VNPLIGPEPHDPVTPPKVLLAEDQAFNTRRLCGGDDTSYPNLHTAPRLASPWYYTEHGEPDKSCNPWVACSHKAREAEDKLEGGGELKVSG
jgi:hypothetical protein